MKYVIKRKLDTAFIVGKIEELYFIIKLLKYFLVSYTIYSISSIIYIKIVSFIIIFI